MWGRLGSISAPLVRQSFSYARTFGKMEEGKIATAGACLVRLKSPSMYKECVCYLGNTFVSVGQVRIIFSSFGEPAVVLLVQLNVQGRER
jgi:hypothetical protein